jgi:rhodanese-related sulfurtransferase
MVPDEPGNLLVVIFPDNIFKYASSVMRHFPDLFPEAGAAPRPGSDLDARLYEEMIKHAKTSRDAVTTGEARGMMDKGALVIDVRKPERYEAQHVKGAVNLPLARLGESLADLPKDKDRPILCVCDRGNISTNGMLYLKALGYSHVKSMIGGTTAWAQEGLPTEP